MFEQFEYTIPANTSLANRAKQELKISIGILTDLFIFFPAGCHGLARCRVFLGEKPVAPRTPSSYVAGDDGPVNVNSLLEPIKPNLPVLNWELWNLDDTYTHTLWLGATWTPLTESELKQILLELKTMNLNLLQIPQLLRGRQLG